MITTKSTLSEILNKYPQLQSVFENNGFKGLDNKLILKQIGNLPLDNLLRNKQINVGLFIDMLNGHLKEDNIDVTLIDKTNKEGAINIIGLLPCPVRIPLLDRFTTLSNLDKINHNLKAASEGLEWLKGEVKLAENEDDLADIYISAGFDLFFENDLMKRFKDQKVFEDYFKERLQDTASESSSASTVTSGVNPVRESGRFIRANVKIASGINYDHAQGVDIAITRAGVR